MDQLKYRNLLKAIATNNKDIANGTDNRRFLEVFQTADPFTREWDADFLSALRTRIDLKSGKSVMVIESISYRWTDRGGQNRDMRPMASFIILKQATTTTKATLDEVNQCLADTNKTCEEILAYIEEQNKQAWHNSNPYDTFFLYMDGAEMLPVKIYDNVYGTRVEFSFMTPKNKALAYNPAKWFTPL